MGAEACEWARFFASAPFWRPLSATVTGRPARAGYPLKLRHEASPRLPIRTASRHRLVSERGPAADWRNECPIGCWALMRGCGWASGLARNQHAAVVLAATKHVVASTAAQFPRLDQAGVETVQIAVARDHVAAAAVRCVCGVLRTTGRERDDKTSHAQSKASGPRDTHSQIRSI